MPNRQGFDYFFGFLNQNHAHNYYPDYLWRNETKVPLPNVVVKGVATKRVVYATDLFTKEALDFIEKNKAQPFFLYLAYTTPHANNEAGKQGMEVPSDEPYSKEPWPQAAEEPCRHDHRAWTATSASCSRNCGSWGSTKTPSSFSPATTARTRKAAAIPYFFNSSGGTARHQAFAARRRHPRADDRPLAGQGAAGPKAITSGRSGTSLPTVAELAGAATPAGLDGLSVAPTLLGKGTQKQHEFLYWEFHEGGFKQGVRMGDWKAVREKLGTPLELYNLKKDISEKTNIAQDNPDVIRQIEAYLAGARTESEFWPIKAAKK